MQGETNRSSTKQPDNIPEMEADRAIQVVKHKLSSRLSVEADVRRLILEATDEGNLSRMYCGNAIIVPCLILTIKDGPHSHSTGARQFVFNC